MEATLVQIDLQVELLLLFKKIMALYYAPTAIIKIIGLLADVVNISNGTWQGIPLSPYLYISAMEHFVMALRANASI